MAAHEWLRPVAAAALLAPLLGAGWWLDRGLPAGDAVARGVVLSTHRADGQRTARQIARTHVETLSRRRVRLSYRGQPVLEASLAELGVQVDEQPLVTALAAVARHGSWWQRIDEARQARRGAVGVVAAWYLPVGVLARRLAPLKQRLDRRPTAARYDFARGAPIAGVEGRVMDPYQLAEAIERAVRSGDEEVSIELRSWPPTVTAAVVARIDRHAVVSRFATRFATLGAQAGRASNVARAAAQLDGLVLLPGQVVSFNHQVGPRSVDNGFAPAGEIYKGEMRMGIGGGTCQVASTLHAAAFLGGLDVVQRSPHSRPSGYIRPGLDATVAYPHVDLRLRNSFDFPIIVHTVVRKGQLEVELLGARRPATVRLVTAAVSARAFKREIRDAPYLAPGTVRRKQKGRRGLTIVKTRRIELDEGRTVVERSTDRYPPTDEIYYVGPDTDVQAVLPPLPGQQVPGSPTAPPAAVQQAAGG